MEAFGSGQDSISPEFLQNIQSAVNSQGVIGQVQVIETENGPVTVLFMEEGADASAAVGDNAALNLSTGVENYVVNTEPSVSEQNADTQYQFVLTEDEYSNLLQGNAEGVGENVALTTVTETVEEEEVTTIPPVINLGEVGQQQPATVSDASELLYATALPQSTTTIPSVPSTEIVTETTTVPEPAPSSSDTYYITDTGEVVRIDSSLLAENGNAIVQMQDTGNGLEVISQEGGYTTTTDQTVYTNVITETDNQIQKPAAASPYKLTATKLDNRLVIDAPKEEPKVLSYKTTNRQRVNIMRQPAPKQTYTISQPTKTRSLLPASLKTAIPQNVGKNVGTSFTNYTAPASKQTILYPGHVRQPQVSNTVKSIQPKMHHEQVITTVTKPQVLKKPVTNQMGYTKQVVDKVPSSRMTSVQYNNQTTTVLVPKFTSNVPKHSANTMKYQSDLLLSAMEEASVTQPASALETANATPLVKTLRQFSNKQVVSANPTVVRDPSTASVEEKVKAPFVSVGMEATVGTTVLHSMPSLEPVAVATNVAEEMEVDQSVPMNVETDIARMEIEKALETVLDEPVPVTESHTETVAETPTPAVGSANDRPVLEAMDIDKVEKVEVEFGDIKEQSKPVIPDASTSKQTVVEAAHVDEMKVETVDDNEKGTQITDIPEDNLKSIDVPDSDVTIQLFADGTLVTKDKAGTNYSTVKLEDLGLDMSMLQNNTDIELLIVQGDGKEVRATINTSKHVNPVAKSVSPVKNNVASVKSEIIEKKSPPATVSDTPDKDKKVGEQEAMLPLNEARPYKCSMCPRTFKFYRTFRCHEIVHSKAVTFTCHLCKRLFAREVNLTSHLELHKKKAASKPDVKEKKVKTGASRPCFDCGQIFETEAKMRKHYQTVHEINPRFPCSICGNLFKSYHVLQKHLKVHVGPFSCPHCGGLFENRASYDEHIKEKHVELTYTCEDCGVFLPSKQAYAMHVVFQHKEKSSAPAVQRKECIVCERRFESHETLERHMIIHSTDKFLECPECSAAFSKPFQLDKHIKDVHDNDVLFPCIKCDEKFKRYQKRDLHVQLHHQGPYQCHVCYEEFPERSLLESHQYINHDGGFTCSKCDNKFETSHKLRLHLTDDHISQEFLCDACGAGFEHKPLLRLHLIETHFFGDKSEMMKQHPEMKCINTEVLCDLCGEYFLARSNYKRHLRDVHFGGDSIALFKIFPALSKVPDPPMPVTCDHCRKEFRSISHLNKHMKSHMRGRKKGKVSLGNDGFESAGNHDEDDDPVDFTTIEPREIEKDYVCKKCNAKFTRKAALDKHITARHRKDLLKEALKNIEKEELERAEKEEKEEKEGKVEKDKVTPVKTKKAVSDKKFKSEPSEEDALAETSVGEPEETSVSHKYACSFCDKVFKTNANLKIHLGKVHPEDGGDVSDTSEKKGFSLKDMKCLKCDKQFTKSRYLRRHLRMVHDIFRMARDDQDILSCMKCPKKFDNAANLNRHMEAKHKKRLVSSDESDHVDEDTADDGPGDITSFLGMNFNLAKTSSCNIESVKKKQHKCTICGKAFSRDATLKKHIAFHNQEESEELESMETEEDFTGLQPPMYPCKSCDNKYSTALGLIHHTRNKHADVDEETVLADILEIDEKFKAESPKKKAEKDLIKKSLKRKAESPKIMPSSPAHAKKKIKVESKKEIKDESPQKQVKFSNSGRLITHSQKLLEQIQCEKCSKTFMKEQHLLMHISRVHFKQETDTELFTCEVCSKSFDKSSKLSLHRIMKHNLRTPAAEKPVGSKSKKASGLNQQINDSNIEIKAESFVCDVCEHAFANQKSLDVHMRKHTGETPYSCCLCSNSFISKYKLECHLKKLHLRQYQKKVKCKICLALFDSTKAMLKHKDVHRKPSTMVKEEKVDRRSMEPHQCSVCKKSFRWKRTLNAHFATHKEVFDVATLKNDFDAFTCGVCNKVFPDKESIKNHVEVHKKSSDLVHACSKCDRAFTKPSGLRLHELSAHKENQEPVASPDVYKCGMCDRTFPKRSGLRMHEVTHTGPLKKAGNVSCNICLENFKSKESLLEHMLCHTSMMPYRCDLCHVSFKYAFSLKAHKLLHNMKPAEVASTSKSGASNISKDKKNEEVESGPTKKEKIKCMKCKKQFSSVIMLRNHTRTVHKNTKAAAGVAMLRKRTTRSTSSESKEEVNKDLKSSKRTISCKLCKMTFTKGNQLIQHLKDAHAEKKLSKPVSKKTPILIKKQEEKTDKNVSSTKTKKQEVRTEKIVPITKQKFPACFNCPNCTKSFTNRYNLRGHLMKAHNATIEEMVDSSQRKKWFYCKDCVCIFWTQAKYESHIKDLHSGMTAKKVDKPVMQPADAEIKVEPFDGPEMSSPDGFKTVQHKCEFCPSVFFTKKLFDEHIVKEHVEHVEEYGIVVEPNPSIELVNDSEDIMGNLISGGLCNFENCNKMSPVVSLKRLRDERGVLLGQGAGDINEEEDDEEEEANVSENDQADGANSDSEMNVAESLETEEQKESIGQVEKTQNIVDNVDENQEEGDTNRDDGRIGEIKVIENTDDCPESTADSPENAADSPENSGDNPDCTAESQENAVDSRENAADGPENAADGSENTADGPENTADGHENTADGPENTADGHENAADGPENAADGPENAADGPEHAADGHENVADSPTEPVGQDEGESNEKEEEESLAGEAMNIDDEPLEDIQNKDTADPSEKVIEIIDNTEQLSEENVGEDEQMVDNEHVMKDSLVKRHELLPTNSELNEEMTDSVNVDNKNILEDNLVKSNEQILTNSELNEESVNMDSENVLEDNSVESNEQIFTNRELNEEMVDSANMDCENVLEDNLVRSNEQLITNSELNVEIPDVHEDIQDQFESNTDNVEEEYNEDIESEIPVVESTESVAYDNVSENIESDRNEYIESIEIESVAHDSVSENVESEKSESNRNEDIENVECVDNDIAMEIESVPIRSESVSPTDLGENDVDDIVPLPPMYMQDEVSQPSELIPDQVVAESELRPTVFVPDQVDNDIEDIDTIKPVYTETVGIEFALTDPTTEVIGAIPDNVVVAEGTRVSVNSEDVPSSSDIVSSGDISL